MAAISITATAVSPSSQAVIRTGIAGTGATITQGMPLYIDANDATYPYSLKLADSDGSGSQIVAGISLNAASPGQRVDYAVSDPSFTIGSTNLAGDDVWLFDTAGQMTITKADLEAGDYVVHIGTYISTTKINLNITQGGVIA